MQCSSLWELASSDKWECVAIGDKIVVTIVANNCTGRCTIWATQEWEVVVVYKPIVSSDKSDPAFDWEDPAVIPATTLSEGADPPRMSCMKTDNGACAAGGGTGGEVGVSASSPSVRILAALAHLEVMASSER